MDNNVSKVNIPLPVVKKTKKTYRSELLTTQNFMRLMPIFCREYVPDRHMTVEVSTYVKGDPLPVPAFGSSKSNSRGFMVPYRCVWPLFDNFITQTPVVDSSGATIVPNSVPTFTNKTLLDFIEAMMSTGSSSDYDVICNHNGTAVYLKHNKPSLFALSVFNVLGYRLNWNDRDTTPMSALKILCYCKVVVDWYFPSAYVGNSYYQAAQAIFERRSIYPLTVSDLNTLYDVLNECCYDHDYFVDGFDQPVGPNYTSYEGSYELTDITNDANYKQKVVNDPNNALAPSATVSRPSNGTPYIGGNYAVSNSLYGVTTQYIVKALQSLTDFTRRHALSGVRALDRYLSEYNINLRNEILKRSMYLGVDQQEIDFTDVVSHSDTSGTGGLPLGALGGKTQSYGNEKFEFSDGQEFGELILINSIVPNITYYQGQNRETFEITPLQFYHPDFDHLGVQAMSAREVYVPEVDGTQPIAGTQNAYNKDLFDKIFCFAPRYSHINSAFSSRAGMYISRLNSGLLPFYSLQRDMSVLYSATTPLANLVHKYDFVIGKDALQYNRVFGVDWLNLKDGIYDPFNCHFAFKVTNYDKTLPAYETFDFAHEDNPKVSVELNGSKLN